MGLFSSIAKLFKTDSKVDACCEDGVCTCSPNGNDSISDPTVTTTTTSPGTVSLSSTSSMPSRDVSVSSSNTVKDSAVIAEKAPVTATVDEINIALETAAAADRLEIEDNLFDLQPDPSIKKKKITSKKPNSKSPRKSPTKRKKN